MRYLITGGCGFLGTNIAASLLATGASVTVLDNMSRIGAIENLKWLREHNPFTKSRVTFVRADVRNPDAILSTIGEVQPDIICHFAGQVAMTTSLANPRLDFETNAYGTLNVLEAIRTVSPQTGLLYSSTNKVYGDLEAIRYEETPTRYVAPDYPQGFSEALPLQFASPYGCSKGAADQYILDYARMYGLRAAVFRHSSMYGARQFATFDQGWIGWFCAQALKQEAGSKEPFTVSGNGKQVRDLLHADDMSALYKLAAENIDTIKGQVFNIGGGIQNSLSILELLAYLQDMLSVKLNFTPIEPRSSDQKIFVADHSAITSAIGWKPEVGWKTGIDAMLAWLREQG